MDWSTEKKDAKNGEEKDSIQNSSRINDDHKPEVVKDQCNVDNSSTSDRLSSTKSTKPKEIRNSRGRRGRLVNSLDLLSDDINVDDSQGSKMIGCSSNNIVDVSQDFAGRKPPPVQAEASTTNERPSKIAKVNNNDTKRQRLDVEINNSKKFELEGDSKKPSVDKKLEAKSITSNIKWGASSSMVSFKSKQAEDTSSGEKRKRSEDQLVPFQSAGEGKIVEMNMKYFTDDDEDDTSSLDVSYFLLFISHIIYVSTHQILPCFIFIE